MIVSFATLEALELPALLALVADEARTDLGARRIVDLRPTADDSELRERRETYEETGRLMVEAPLVPSFETPLAPLLERLAGQGPPLEGSEILLVARLLAVGGEAVERIDAADPACEELAGLRAGIGDARPLVRKIERVLDRQGRVRDDASPRLVKLQGELRRSRERLYVELERMRGDHAELFNDETVPLRGGRLMLMLSAGARGRVPGLVHGRSASGKSFYFEPLAVVEENNAAETASEEIENERRRLLRELLATLTAELALVERLAELVATLDAYEAMTRFAAASEARPAAIASASRARLVGARHPLLDPRLAGRRRRVLGAAGHEGEIVPLDLELDAERRLLVVTGPNAGGKTVALKTFGLLALAHQAGLPVPAAAGSELPVFGSVVATIGDEQDLLAERSTFSGRLERLGEIWQEASSRGLSLVDELGSGTDPEEGAALGVALVERIVAQGGLGVVTTHLAAVALAALDLDGAACAAMEFDAASGGPTFRLQPGAPGASEAIALARRLGLPSAWVSRAEELVGGEHRDLQRVLAELEQTRLDLARAAAEADRRGAEAELVTARAERARAELETERRDLGRRFEAKLEEFRRRVGRDLAVEVERMRKELDRGRRRGLDRQATARLFAAAPEFSAPENAVESAELPVVGGAVRHRTLGWRGRLVRLDGERAEVEVAGKRLVCSGSDLVAAEQTARQAGVESRGAGLAEVAEEPAAELMLLGFTIEEALVALERHLDLALRDGRAQTRIVHGHGTGRLRRAVREHLDRHPAVRRHRAGEASEGGNGATVVELRA